MTTREQITLGTIVSCNENEDPLHVVASIYELVIADPEREPMPLTDSELARLARFHHAQATLPSGKVAHLYVQRIPRLWIRGLYVPDSALALFAGSSRSWRKDRDVLATVIRGWAEAWANTQQERLAIKVTTLQHGTGGALTFTHTSAVFTAIEEGQPE